MQLIFNREAAEELMDKYTILELEAVPADGKMLDVFCLVPSESIIMEISTLEQNIELHREFVQAIRDDNVATCLDLGQSLMHKFGGELDSFYQIIMDRCKETGSTKFSIPEQIPE